MTIVILYTRDGDFSYTSSSGDGKKSIGICSLVVEPTRFGSALGIDVKMHMVIPKYQLVQLGNYYD